MISETERQVEQLKKEQKALLMSHGSTQALSDDARKFRIVTPGTVFNNTTSNNSSSRNSGGGGSGGGGGGGRRNVRTEQQLIMAASKERRDKAKQRGRMTTKAMRDLEAIKRQRLYAETVLRIQFPSRFVVEGIFRPDETIEQVCAVLRRLVLSDACVESEFYLFMTPPKTMMKSQKKLSEIGCCPAALMYLGWSNGSPPAEMDQLFRVSLHSSSDTHQQRVNNGSGNSSSSTHNYPKALNAEEFSNTKHGRKTSKSREEMKNNMEKKNNNKSKPSWLKL